MAKAPLDMVLLAKWFNKYAKKDKIPFHKSRNMNSLAMDSSIL